MPLAKLLFVLGSGIFWGLGKPLIRGSHKMAERVGFEPTVQLPGLRFSRPVLSTAQPSLRGNCRAYLSPFQAGFVNISLRRLPDPEAIALASETRGPVQVPMQRLRNLDVSIAVLVVLQDRNE